MLAATAAILPSALRPPQHPPNTSAELSPDAPPDPTQDAIVAALNRGTSGTAGAGAGEGEAADRQAQTPAAGDGRVLPTAIPRACPGGFGDPPRQVQSLYSAPCAAAWEGDNGGATYKNVSATEIRVGVVLSSTAEDGLGLDEGEGEGPAISDEPFPDESGGHRTWRVYQRYFNQNFQLSGRYLRLFVISVPSGGDQDARMKAAVQDLDEIHHVFAIFSLSHAAMEETARRGLVGMGGWNARGPFYDDNQPYLAGWWMDGTRLMRINAEYLCKKLVGRDAEFAGDPSMTVTERKLGLIVGTWSPYGTGPGDELPGLVKQQCGADLLVEHFTELSDASAHSTGVAKFKLEGVTTVVIDMDPLYFASYLASADSQGYYPEWYVPGTWVNDESDIPVFFGYSRTQWAHAFGLSDEVMAQRRQDKDNWKAYASIDPGNQPTDGGNFFHFVLQIANGIQMAGPHVTPETFRDGLSRMGKRPNIPLSSVGGGFAPGDHTYADDLAEIWWDNSAPNPGSNPANRDVANTPPGAYRYVDCGRRYAEGTIPAGDTKLFDPAGSCTVEPA